MKTLTVEEATPGLGRLIDLALAGEQIQIRKGNGIVELRPAQVDQTTVKEQLTPREALRKLQEEGRLTPQQAESYLRGEAALGRREYFEKYLAAVPDAPPQPGDEL